MKRNSLLLLLLIQTTYLVAQDEISINKGWSYDVGLRLGSQVGQPILLYRPYKERVYPRVFFQANYSDFGLSLSYADDAINLGSTLGVSFIYMIIHNMFFFGEITRHVGEGIQRVEISTNDSLKYYYKWDIVQSEFGLGIIQRTSFLKDLGIALAFGIRNRQKEDLEIIRSKSEFDETNFDSEADSLCDPCTFMTWSLSLFYKI